MSPRRFRAVAHYCVPALLILAQVAAAQLGAGQGSSLDMTFDPRSVSLGEATVALAGSYDAFASNPAGLATLKGAWMSYDRRGMEWTEVLGMDDLRYRSWAAGANTPWGTFSFEYRRMDYGEFSVTGPESPDVLGKVYVYNHEFGLAWGLCLARSISIGAVAKTYTDVQSTEGLSGASPYDLETQRPYLLDLGFLYNIGSLIGNERLVDNIALGAALQNFGTDYRFKVATGLEPGVTSEEYIALPRTLRIGVAYQLSLHGSEPTSPPILRVNVLGEYRNVLNSFPGPHEYHWGWGAEFTAYDIFSIRLGGYFQPYSSVYGGDRVVAVRLGAGLHLPLKLLSDGMPPLAFNVDYAAIPLNGNGSPYYYPFNSAPGTANVYTLRIQYEADLMGGGQ